MAVPGEGAAPIEKLGSKRAPGELRKLPLSGRTCGVRGQVSLVGRRQLVTSLESWNENPGMRILEFILKSQGPLEGLKQSVTWRGTQLGRSVLVAPGWREGTEEA